MKKLSLILITGCLFCLNIACFGQNDNNTGCSDKKKYAFLKSRQAFVQFGIGASPMIVDSCLNRAAPKQAVGAPGTA